ncbi:hypothetical protein Pcar_3324 [Syntrophotalea carbinolica DSM 2380]|uniref:Uncharacterized protein n=1 Tax=Syntrophotalea carbinolica (strain DSM 2380 / NBRC 103641 / GraBd1) TaxID=338963 RepID=Q0C6J7_SYNC1|nr:hypothetical protein Pcar_3324 [Syntrophotalea carbinolica DSM 2380]
MVNHNYCHAYDSKSFSLFSGLDRSELYEKYRSQSNGKAKQETQTIMEV